MRSVRGSIALLMCVLLAACVSQRPAPVVDRSGRSAPVATAPLPSVAPPTVREANDGVYVVQRGDTLFGVAIAFGVTQRDLARWNDLAVGAALRPGQSLRVVEPSDVATATPITGTGEAEVRPLPLPGTSGTAAPPAPLPPVTAPAVPAPPSITPVVPPPDTARPTLSPIPWLWPTAGKVVETFDDPRNKGIDIAGVEGASVQAAADGEVVYVGSAVRGYGNLVIVRHSDEFITAYAHNRKVLVAEKQAVKRGQAIAELGRSDADRPKLHFEIRHQGKPVDPLKYLPAR